jgi:hypothetical protein
VTARTQIPVVVLQRDTKGAYDDEPETLLVKVGAKKVDESKSDTFALECDPGVFYLTGLQAGTIPNDLANEIYDDVSAPITIVAGVTLGSPAYLAGFRSADRIISCDGQPVQSYRDISQAVLARSAKLNPPRGWFEDPTPPSEAAPQKQFPIEVEGPLGRHTGSVRLVNNLDERSSFRVPIIFNRSSDVRSTNWRFMHFIFQWGATYRSKYYASESRASTRTSFFSLFPLGMFQFENGREDTRYRFFWLIRFRVRH